MSVGVDATANLEFAFTNSSKLEFSTATTPTSFTVSIDGVPTLSGGDRIEIHLPGFGGAYNSFGSLHDIGYIEAYPSHNGIKAYDAEGEPVDLVSAEWDAARQVLKLTTREPFIAGGFLAAVTVDHAHLRLGHSSTGLPSGLGPLPPSGGIDANWYKTAWVRWYKHDERMDAFGSFLGLCTGAFGSALGLGSETCTFTDFLGTPDPALFQEIMWDSVQMPLTGNSRLPGQLIGAAGTAVAPTFSLLKAEGTTTGYGSINCMTVTMVPNVALVTTADAYVTAITLHGLTGAATTSTDTLPLYFDRACDTAPIGSEEIGADAVWSKEEGTLVFEINEGRSISAGQVMNPTLHPEPSTPNPQPSTRNSQP